MDKTSPIQKNFTLKPNMTSKDVKQDYDDQYMFSIFDSDKNGTISNREYEVFKRSFSGKDTISYDEVEKVLESHRTDKNSELSQNLYADITAKKYGVIPTTGPEFSTHLKSINKYNVAEVLINYQNLPDNENGNSLIHDILNEYGLETKEKIKYVSDIIFSINEAAIHVGNEDVVNLLKDTTGELKDIIGNDIIPINFTERLDRIIDMCFADLRYIDGYGVDVYRQVVRQNADSELVQKHSKLVQGIDGEKYFTLDKKGIKAIIDEGAATNETLADLQTNGKVDRYFQQETQGDCVYIAFIKGLSQTPNGRKIIEESIKPNEDGSVTVHLKGVNKTYVISLLDMATYEADFSSGDKDPLALLIAINRFLSENEMRTINGSDSLEPYNILVDNKYSDEQIEDIVWKDFLKNMIGGESIFTEEDFENFNKDNVVATVGSGPCLPKTFVDRFGKRQWLIPMHEYTVKAATANFVYIINPGNTEEVIEVPKKLFENFFYGKGIHKLKQE